MKHGRLEMNPLRQFPSVPIVQLSGGCFKKVRRHVQLHDVFMDYITVRIILCASYSAIRRTNFVDCKTVVLFANLRWSVEMRNLRAKGLEHEIGE